MDARYGVEAHSTDTFGRVLCAARNHHFVVDGPVSNGCPGEAITPVELFLSGVASCGVELVQVLAREQGLDPIGVSVTVEGELDRKNPVRRDLTVFNKVWLSFRLKGLTEAEGKQLIEMFKER
jgi:uncharacterized OsmC-like protein